MYSSPNKAEVVRGTIDHGDFKYPIGYFDANNEKYVPLKVYRRKSSSGALDTVAEFDSSL